MRAYEEAPPSPPILGWREQTRIFQTKTSKETGLEAAESRCCGNRGRTCRCFSGRRRVPRAGVGVPPPAGAQGVCVCVQGAEPRAGLGVPGSSPASAPHVLSSEPQSLPRREVGAAVALAPRGPVGTMRAPVPSTHLHWGYSVRIPIPFMETLRLQEGGYRLAPRPRCWL